MISKEEIIRRMTPIVTTLADSIVDPKITKEEFVNLVDAYCMEIKKIRGVNDGTSN